MKASRIVPKTWGALREGRGGGELVGGGGEVVAVAKGCEAYGQHKLTGACHRLSEWPM